MIHALIVLALVSQQPNLAAPSLRLVVTGTVLDERNKPIDHAKVYLSKKSEDDGRERVVARGETDADGRYRVEVRERVEIRLVGFDLPVTLWTWKPGRAITASRIPFDKGPTIPGVILKNRHEKDSLWTVLGADGAPVADARIAPASIRINALVFVVPEELRDEIEFRTDDKGKTTIQGFDVGSIASIRVDSKSFGRQFGPPPIKDSPIVLSPVASVKGRLIADDRSSLNGRYFLISTQSDNPALKFQSGEALVVTDSQGRFEVPAIAAGESTIREVRISRNDSITEYPIIKRSIEPGKVSLEIKAIAPWGETRWGTVVDRKGEPVADAEVFTRGDTVATITTKTDRDGRFTLKGVPRSRFFVFVKKQGYRFVGKIVLQEDASIDLRIAKVEEQSIAPMKTLPISLSKSERIAIAHKIFDSYFERTLRDGTESQKMTLIHTLARIDPERAVAIVDERPPASRHSDMVTRQIAALALAEESIDDSLQIAEAMSDPAYKVHTFIDVCDRVPANDRPKKLAILERAFVQAKNNKTPRERVRGVGLIADRLFDLGETDRATKLLRDAIEEARGLPPIDQAGLVRGFFAEELSVIDLPSALDIIKGITYNRHDLVHLGGVAHELAARSPADSERVLAMIDERRFRDPHAVPVCYRMAAVDLSRARKIANEIGLQAYRGYALGVMADRLAEIDKTEAKNSLDQSFETLEDLSIQERDLDLAVMSPSVIAAALLYAAEKIDPALVSEYFWKAISFRRPIELSSTQRIAHAGFDAVLAELIARYDRKIARSLLAISDPSKIDDYRVVVASVAIDPRWTIELIDKLAESKKIDNFEVKNRSRWASVEALSKRDALFWRHITRRYAGLWIPDSKQFDPYQDE